MRRRSERAKEEKAEGIEENIPIKDWQKKTVGPNRTLLNTWWTFADTIYGIKLLESWEKHGHNAMQCKIADEPLLTQRRQWLTNFAC